VNGRKPSRFPAGDDWLVPRAVSELAELDGRELAGGVKARSPLSVADLDAPALALPAFRLPGLFVSRFEAVPAEGFPAVPVVVLRAELNPPVVARPPAVNPLT